jgi:hypothetical protein
MMCEVPAPDTSPVASDPHLAPSQALSSSTLGIHLLLHCPILLSICFQVGVLLALPLMPGFFSGSTLRCTECCKIVTSNPQTLQLT